MRWRFGQQPPLERPKADLLVHPALEERLRRHPEVEIGIELAPEALDVEQRLLQQHELRLDLHVEATRRLEQPHQHLAELDLLAAAGRRSARRPRGSRLRTRPSACSRRHPAATRGALRDALVVATEEREEILREVALVPLGQRAHDAEIERDVLAVVDGASTPTKMLPGCMSAWKKPSRNTCVKKISTPVARQPLQCPRRPSTQSAMLPDRHAGHPLHHHHFARRAQSQWISGTLQERRDCAKLRRNCERSPLRA